MYWRSRVTGSSQATNKELTPESFPTLHLWYLIINPFTHLKLNKIPERPSTILISSHECVAGHSVKCHYVTLAAN